MALSNLDETQHRSHRSHCRQGSRLVMILGRGEVSVDLVGQE